LSKQTTVYVEEIIGIGSGTEFEIQTIKINSNAFKVLYSTKFDQFNHKLNAFKQSQLNQAKNQQKLEKVNQD
jgi:hypothetical protein